MTFISLILFFFFSFFSSFSISSSSSSFIVDYSCLHSSSWLLYNKQLQFSFKQQEKEEEEEQQQQLQKQHKQQLQQQKQQQEQQQERSNLKYNIINSERCDREWNITTLNYFNYKHQINQNDILKYNLLNNLKDKVIYFEEDIGMKGCNGYWPDNIECYNKIKSQSSFQLKPARELNSIGCYQNRDIIGKFVNGANIFSFLDYSLKDEMMSNNKNDNNNIKSKYWIPLKTTLKSDICSGIIENNQYGHFSYSNCLSDMIDDTKMTHSKIFGWSYDNYPIFGPFQSSGVLAQSSWFKREYTSTSVTGCSSHGERNCILKNNYNYKEGVIYLKSQDIGLPIDDNNLETVSGRFYEDYYFNSTHYSLNKNSPYNEFLDEYNGHSHEPYGYHYHITINKEMEPVFPFIIGPKYYGCQFNTKRKCCSSVYATELSTSNLNSFSFESIENNDNYDQCIEISNENSICGITDSSYEFQCSKTSLDTHRHLDSTELSTPTWTFSPTAVPTRFSSPTFKPTLEFVSQQPTLVTFSPTTTPSTAKENKGAKEEKTFTADNIVFIVLVVVGGVVILVSCGILIYWRLYTRTGEEYQDASSSTYIEKMKDFTSGISLVER